MSDFWTGYVLGVVTVVIPLALLMVRSAIKASHSAEQAIEEMMQRSNRIMPVPMQQAKEPPRSMWSN